MSDLPSLLFQLLPEHWLFMDVLSQHAPKLSLVEASVRKPKLRQKSEVQLLYGETRWQRRSTNPYQAIIEGFNKPTWFSEKYLRW